MITTPTTYSLSLAVSVASTTEGLKYDPIGTVFRLLFIIAYVSFIDIPLYIYYSTKKTILRRNK